jgi:quercetin dioxygenase-like cupin family protein
MKKAHYRGIPAAPVSEEGASGVTIRWVISKQDGAPTFSMRVFEVEPGGYTPHHHHPWEHEIFILEGQGALVQGEKKTPFSKGDVIYMPPDEQHQIQNTSAENLEFICLIPNPK